MTKILAVDDEPQILRALRINLSARQYEVAVAADGSSAWSRSPTPPRPWARSWPPQPPARCTADAPDERRTRGVRPGPDLPDLELDEQGRNASRLVVSAAASPSIRYSHVGVGLGLALSRGLAEAMGGAPIPTSARPRPRRRSAG
jgi:hypothetical protein